MLQLVLDESQRADYEQMLKGSINARWGAYVRQHWGKAGSSMMVPIFHFLYDDGTIPFKRSIVEENIDRTRRGHAPLPMDHLPRDHWALSPTHDDIAGASTEELVDRATREREGTFRSGDLPRPFARYKAATA